MTRSPEDALRGGTSSKSWGPPEASPVHSLSAGLNGVHGGMRAGRGGSRGHAARPDANEALRLPFGRGFGERRICAVNEAPGHAARSDANGMRALAAETQGGAHSSVWVWFNRPHCTAARQGREDVRCNVQAAGSSCRFVSGLGSPVRCVVCVNVMRWQRDRAMGGSCRSGSLSGRDCPQFIRKSLCAGGPTRRL